MDAPLVVRRGRPVHRGPHERMAEAHLGAELDQAGRLRRSRRVAVDPERGGRLPHQQRIAHRLGRRDQEQEPRRRRQLRQALLEALLDAAGQRRPAVQPQPARQLGGRQAAWQLQQRQRIAARLGHDPIAHPLVERTRHHGLQQRPRITVVEPADHELRQPLEMPLPGRLAHGEDQPDRLGPQTARHEGQRLRRGAVEPLRVVHDADQRSLLGHVRQQAQDRQADEEPIRRVAVAHAERRAERLALRAWKALQAIRRTARRADAARRTRAPSPTRRPPPVRCRSRTRAAPDSRAARSCRRRPRRAAPAPGSDPRAHSPPAHPAPRTRCAGRATAAHELDMATRRGYVRPGLLATASTDQGLSLARCERRTSRLEDAHQPLKEIPCARLRPTPAAPVTRDSTPRGWRCCSSS